MHKVDTLAAIAIARAVRGDESLWYMVAEANGLVGNDPLIEGPVRGIPDKVSNLHNSTNTLKVYNADQAISVSVSESPSMHDLPDLRTYVISMTT